MPSSTLVSRTFSTHRQSTHYIECGPADGRLMIFLHGWPGIGLIWHTQMDAFAADGWHCVAPDLRGYGGSSAPAGNDSYTIKEVVADMAELHDHLGGKPAIWVGHDWGSVVAGAFRGGRHRPRCRPGNNAGVGLSTGGPATIGWLPEAFYFRTASASRSSRSSLASLTGTLSRQSWMWSRVASPARTALQAPYNQPCPPNVTNRHA